MISAFRRYLDTWPVRAFFAVMVLAFVFWGVGDVVRNVGVSTWVAKIDGATIEGAAMQQEFQRALSQAMRDRPDMPEATADLRRKVGEETLRRMIQDAAFQGALREYRIVAPDAAVAEIARANPAFRGPDGKFSKTAFDAVLRANGLTEPRFLDFVRADMARRQVLGAVEAGAAVPGQMLDRLYAAEYQKRSARVAEFPLAAAPDPGAPDEAALARWYDNHPDLYMRPEYRRLRAVALTPQRLAQEVTATDDELRDAYARMRPQLVVPARRTARVATAPDEAKARALAEKWRAGADWDAIAAAAQADGGAGIPLDDVVDAQIPDRDLAKAVFAAPLDAVTDPVKGALSWYVVRVSAATAGEDPDFDAARERVREKVAADKAADLMYERANKVDALLANGVSLEDMPGDLGLVGIAGTLDRDGMTPENELAPIPGAAELRAALIEAAFATQQGDPPRLTEVRTPSLGGTAYYALSVEAVTPTVLRPLAEVKDRAIEDWRADRQRKHQEEAAAKMLAAVKSGQAFADAATVAGAPERVTPLATRAEAPEGVPPELLRAIFALKPGEPTMVETAEAFVVAALEQALDPDPKNDPDGYAQARAAVGRGVAQDIGATYLEALRLRANPRIDQKNLDRVVQP